MTTYNTKLSKDIGKIQNILNIFKYNQETQYCIKDLRKLSNVGLMSMKSVLLFLESNKLIKSTYDIKKTYIYNKKVNEL